MISIALYKPDIPQNTAAILRLSACLKIKVHIIEPCAFNLADPRFRRVIMDYNRFITLKKYHDYDSFDNDNHKSRIILMTTSLNFIRMISCFMVMRVQVFLCLYMRKSKQN